VLNGLHLKNNDETTGHLYIIIQKVSEYNCCYSQQSFVSNESFIFVDDDNTCVLKRPI